MTSPTYLRSYLSAKHRGTSLEEQFPIVSTDSTDGTGPVVWVNPDKAFQEIEGFGGAFTEAAAVTWLKLGDVQRAQVLRAYFDPKAGHGYTLCRVHMNSCDFALGNYAHAEVHDDVPLEHFTIERDRQALLPFIKAAQQVAGTPLKLLVSPWSPPAWMKSNGQMNHGGKLLPQYRAAWAQCYVKFIQAYAEEGVPVWGVSVQNEPMAVQRWDSCVYSAEEERDFVRDHLGPALEQAGLQHVRIIVWDHNRDEMVERASVVLSDPQAARYVWGTGFHWYVEDHFEHVQLVHDAWPDKRLLFTEGCQEGGPHTGEWEVGERYACSMINDLNRWTVGWIDWNLLLDTQGGPNHVGNYCSAPLLADTENDLVLPQVSYTYIGHFSRFVRPGARRILCAATREVLECTALLNPDQTVVVVVMNRSENEVPFDIKIRGMRWAICLPPRAIASYVL
ncbi:glucosylceramidase [Rhodoferax lacus]|uniref:Glucosylceramidase n=1 Tax=Rhodoferax lacus TaxID=2184758 RepID=A0A3E1RG44_9BURK|nr:glycoside hydrolase family 30 protein [Rhodoferax lacus]RFO98324.1 glucosylceramidase [Rhodoferax lacus]